MRCEHPPRGLAGQTERRRDRGPVTSHAWPRTDAARPTAGPAFTLRRAACFVSLIRQAAGNHRQVVDRRLNRYLEISEQPPRGDTGVTSLAPRSESRPGVCVESRPESGNRRRSFVRPTVSTAGNLRSLLLRRDVPPPSGVRTLAHTISLTPKEKCDRRCLATTLRKLSMIKEVSVNHFGDRDNSNP